MTDAVGVPYFRPNIGDAEIAAVAECLRSGWLTSGPNVKAFEARFAEMLGVKHALAVTSCTAALHIALEAIGLQRGDLVLVPALTFAATAEVVRYFDAIPVLVDSEAETLCMDLDKVEETLEALGKQQPIAGLKPPFGPVRAMIPVHYAGQMVAMDRFRAIADRYDIALIEDAAHAFPAACRSGDGQPWVHPGQLGDIACFSFYANKCITTGEGGMAVTNNDALAERMQMMALHGLSKDAWQRFTSEGSWYYEIVAPGFKYNMTDILAALGRVQLDKAQTMCDRRTELAALYTEALEDTPGIQLPRAQPHRQHAWHLFHIQVHDEVHGQTRDAVIAGLKAVGIGTSVHWMPLHLHPYYRDTFGYREGQFPVAETVWRRLISLPMFPDMSDADVAYVVDHVQQLVGKGAAA